MAMSPRQQSNTLCGFWACIGLRVLTGPLVGPCSICETQIGSRVIRHSGSAINHVRLFPFLSPTPTKVNAACS